VDEIHRLFQSVATVQISETDGGILPPYTTLKAEEKFIMHKKQMIYRDMINLYENCSSSLSPNYQRQIQNIKILFSLVPEHMKPTLRWNPDIEK